MAAVLPDIMAGIFKQASSTLPLSFTASVNSKRAVTLTANPRTSSTAYAPFFELLTKKLNQFFPVNENLYQAFRPAPAYKELQIHSVPLFTLPLSHEELYPCLLESIGNAIDTPIHGSHFLQPDPDVRAEKFTTTVVVSVSPEDVGKFGESIRLFSCPCKVTPAHPASKPTQCKKCWKFGHSHLLCKVHEHTCPICSALHSRSQHRCPNQSCAKEGHLNSVIACCITSPPQCVKYQSEHATFDSNCPTRRSIAASLRPALGPQLPEPSSDPIVGTFTGLHTTVAHGPPLPATPANPIPRPSSAVPTTVRQGPADNSSFSVPPPLATPLLQYSLFGPSPNATWALRSDDNAVDEDL